MNYKVPILFLTFNRFEETCLVFEKIASYKPKVLYISSDGGRTDEEWEIVDEVRNYMLGRIDWDVELITIFNSANQGCKKAVSSAITYFFSNVEYGIVLEDDCLPSLDFFFYSERMLLLYKDDLSVFHISGSSFIRDDCSYLSKYAFVWGWASWSNRWAYYSQDMVSLNFTGNIENSYSSQRERVYWRSIFNKSKLGLIDTWDYQWIFTIRNYCGITVLPPWNMIKNIGFNSKATHTSSDVGLSIEHGEGDVSLIGEYGLNRFDDGRLFDVVYYKNLSIFQKVVLNVKVLFNLN